MFAGDALTLEVYALAQPRAYHAAATLQAMGSVRLIVAGGLDSQARSNPNLELFSPGQPADLLDDPLTTGAIGLAMAPLPDGSLLLIGGLDHDGAGQVGLSDQGQILTP
jgi:hypothetical protein